MNVSIVLPIHNERENLGQLFVEIDQAFQSLRKRCEVIAVDDASTDGSTELLKELAVQYPNTHTKIVVFRRQAGQTAAFSAGFQHAQGEAIVTLDADGQNDPADIPRLLEKLDEGYDCVTGYRENRQDRFTSRKLPSLIANWFIRVCTRTTARDLGCSIRAYRREILQELRLYGEMHRFLVVLIEGVGGRVAEVPVNHRARTGGKSKYGLNRMLKVPLDLLTVWFLRKYQTKPLYLFGGAGFAALSFAFLFAATALYEKFWHGVWVHRNPIFFFSITCAIVAALFFGMGLLAELLIRTYFESQGKPAYFIADRIGFVGGRPAKALAQ